MANIRAYCTESVVEHVMGSLLVLAHSLGRYDAAVKAGDWQQASEFCMLDFPIRQLSEMTMGIVGYGALGQGVAAAARAFGMQTLVSARPGSTSVDDGRVAFADLLAESDVISLHCPLTDDTRKLFDARTMARMKPGSLLINSARGALVDAFVEELRARGTLTTAAETELVAVKNKVQNADFVGLARFDAVLPLYRQFAAAIGAPVIDATDRHAARLDLLRRFAATLAEFAG